MIIISLTYFWKKSVIWSLLSDFILLDFRYRTVTNVVDPMTNMTTLDVEVTEMWQNRTFALSITWIHNLLRSVIPLLILCVLNYYIIQSLRHTKSTRKKLSSRNRITVMLLSIVIVFVVCITPDTVMTFIGLGYTDANYLARAIREITDLLLTINSGVNFILYCIFNKAFRKEFMLLFCTKCAENRPSYERQYEETVFAHSSFRPLSRRSSPKTNGNTPRNSKPNIAVTVENEFLQTLM